MDSADGLGWIQCTLATLSLAETGMGVGISSFGYDRGARFAIDNGEGSDLVIS